MTLDQLRIFLEVARREHVTRTADALNMTQSATSAAISALEQRHGVALFDRVGRGITLTEAGRRFVPYAQAALRSAAEAEAFLLDIRSGVAGTLRLAASQTVATYFLPALLMAFRLDYPKVDLGLVQANTSTVAASVLSGDADLGVVEGEVKSAELTIEPLQGDRLILVVGQHHHWADGQALGDGELASADWVLRERGSGTRAAFDAAISARGIDAAAITILMELPSNEACIAAVEAGQGITAISELAAEPHLASGLLRRAGYPMPHRRFSILTHRMRHRSQAAERFIAMLKMARGS